MRIIHSLDECRETLTCARANDQNIGFVPTMGALHDGHRSLIVGSVEQNDLNVVSIFVNPLQFAEDEDLDAYPRTLAEDAEIVRDAGADIVFAPSARDMYPQPIWTHVAVDVITEHFEGESRPTHFSGVATVVTKLFNIVGPCRAYFGEKDFQQLAMIKRMVSDLNQPVEVIGMPTVREPDGLAMSSRNRYLTTQTRIEAPAVFRALQRAVAAVNGGETEAAKIEALLCDELASTSATLEYAVAVQANSLERLKRLSGEVRLLIAADFGEVRLIDNVGVVVP